MMDQKWLQLLQKMVDINSGTGNLAGSEKIRQLLVPEFESLGFQTRVETVQENHRVLICDFPGEKPQLALVGHIDTVFPSHSPFQKMRIEGDRVIGPGVIDMKGGIVLLLHLLHTLKGSIDLGKIRILLNDDEEIGSRYSKNLFKELAAGVPFGLVFEPGLPDRSLVSSESGVLRMELKVKGVPAHAGLEHEKGVNAGLELAHKLVKLSALTDYSKGLTLSVGTLQGGTAVNVVCENASAELDIRYVQNEDLEYIQKELEKVRREMTVRSAEGGVPPTAELETLAHLPSFPQTSAQGLFPFLHDALDETGQDIRCQHVGYGSDANHLAQTGMSLLVGLGLYGGGMHTHDEFMSVASYEQRLKLGQALIKRILKAAS